MKASRAVVLVALSLAPWLGARAQVVLERALVREKQNCDGDTISTIVIRSHPPAHSGRVAATQRIASGWLRLSQTTTRPQVIAAYMRLVSGTICSEIDRSESERILRAQPFIASATIHTVTEGPQRVRLEVDVVDEQRLVIGAGTRHGTVSSLILGTENLSGRGASLAFWATRGFAYRDGVGFRGVKYGMFGRPDFLAITAERRAVIGEHLEIELAEPFLTDRQSRGYHVRSGLSSGYTRLVRPVGDPVSVFVRRTSYDLSTVTRFGQPSGRNAVGLLGAALIGEDVRTGPELVVVADTGLVRQVVNPFAGSYPGFTTTRLAAIAGVRALRYITVSAFDAISAEQDMGIGVQLDVLAGPSLQSSGGAADFFMASDFYAGLGNERTFFAARGLLEGRREHRAQRWKGMVSNVRFDGYHRSTVKSTSKLSIEYSGTRALAFPLQLTLRDPESGLPGYGKATMAGGHRLIGRFDERLYLTTIRGRVELAAGAFASAGRLWAGDAPYGATTGMLGAAGLSLTAAFPEGSKRSYRLDVAFPFDPARAETRVEVRLVSSDRTRRLWAEPSDLNRARTGAAPVTLMKW